MRDETNAGARRASATSERLGAIGTTRAPVPGDVVIADGLPLERLYARFDAIARGRVHGDSSAAHRSVIARLSSNQLRASALGWTDFVLERAGGSGRLELRGNRPSGQVRELVPDAIPYDADALPANSPASNAPLRSTEGRLGTDVANVSWRSRMSWLDDGGR